VAEGRGRHSAEVHEEPAVAGEMPGRFPRPVVETGAGNHGGRADRQGAGRDQRQPRPGLETAGDQLSFAAVEDQEVWGRSGVGAACRMRAV